MYFEVTSGPPRGPIDANFSEISGDKLSSYTLHLIDMKAAKVLSLSFSAEKLELRENALLANSFEVKSVLSPGQARYEIETGRYDIFLTCAAVPDIVNQDLMNLFRRSCGEEGLIILIEGDGVISKTAYPLPADIRIPKALDPDGIIQALQDRQRSPEASAE